MRVLHVVSRLQYGGIERYLLTLVRGLDRSQFACDVACVGHRSSENDPLVPAFREAGASVWHVPVTPGGPRQLAAFRACALDGAYDVVHCHLGDASGVLAAALVGSGVRFIASYHNANMYPDISPATRLALRAGRYWLRLARVPLSGCSDYAILSHFDGPPRGPWLSAYYGVDTDRFRPAPAAERLALRQTLGIDADRIVITHIGRFVVQKDHALLLDTAQRVAARLPDALFVLVGSGPLTDWVKHEVARRGLGRTIQHVAATDAPESYLRASDVFFMPSRFEGFGLALLEAHASGLPAVATDLPAFREFAAGWPAVRLVRPRATSLAASLLEMIADLRTAQERAQRAQPEIRERFSIEAAVERWKDVIRILGGPVRGRIPQRGWVRVRAHRPRVGLKGGLSS